MERLLVANRGEIAVRVLRTATEMGLSTVAVFSDEDAAALHVRRATAAVGLGKSGVAAFLDADLLIAAAVEQGADAIHPGYGFLSENADFARRCRDAGLTFVGPTAEILDLFGDKAQGRALALECDVPVLPGTTGATTLEEAREFLASLGEGGAVMVKAVAGGGGRGMRVVNSRGDLDEAYERCQSEARQSFGNGDLFVEQLLPRARHIEVQILGDGTGAVAHLGERECTLQRRNQKLVEMAPSPSLSSEERHAILAAAVRMAEQVRFQSIGTFEFLVDADDPDRFAFIEANPRLQVEHTVTEEVTGVDLVQCQLLLAAGRTMADLPIGAARGRGGLAVQLRVNTESMTGDGRPRPTGGMLSSFNVPSGPGVRVDTAGYAGYRTSPSFDSLLAKLIVHVPSMDLGGALIRARRALAEFEIGGVATNAGFLMKLIGHADVINGRVTTRFVEDHINELLPDEPVPTTGEGRAGAAGAGARIDNVDPLAVLHHGKAVTDEAGIDDLGLPLPEGVIVIEAPVQGTIVSISVGEGDLVHEGQQVVVMEAMKMEHVIAAPASGVIEQVLVTPGDTLFEGHSLIFMQPADVESAQAGADVSIDLDAIRPDLAEVHERHAVGLDEARPDAVERRRKTRQRTTRENVDDLCDPGSFVEYGPLVIAAQRRRRSLEDLIARTPADGLVAGVGTVNADLFGPDRSRCAVMSYDYTVLAGTQGMQNHRKKDRMFELAERSRLPVVFFTEGGGGRPGDTDGTGVAGLDCMAFYLFGRLSGLVPLVGINSGRCFAGNAAILGCCDVVIATANSNIGMGGPAMIEGGGLGVFRPDEVGPMSVQVHNGVVDIPVADEAEAVDVARRYLSYFQGTVGDWEAADQRLLRTIIPENRLRIYDVRSVISTMADEGSVLELRRHFGHGMVTAFVRIEGRPVGVVANNPTHLAGAIDADGADKATRFMQLCDAFDIPLLFLCDTPGIMVGPEIEKTALVRHCSRMFVTGASLSVPFFTVILRKGYGLGAQAMAGGSFKAPIFTVAWPTGEFGGMGLEGAVKLGYRNELAAIEDPAERRALFEEMVARMYEHGKAVNTASHFGIDDVIDPVDSRRWIVNALQSAPPPATRTGKKRPCIDTW